MKSYKELSEIIKNSVGLESEPVGIKFLKSASAANGAKLVEDHRFCQLIMRARRGEELLLTKDEITNPAAAAAFGFKPLAEKLQDGSMLQGYGIFKDKEAAIKVMNDMPRLEQGRFEAIVAKPLKDWEEEPDVIVIEDEVEKLM